MITLAISMLKRLEQVRSLLITESIQMLTHMNFGVFARRVLPFLSMGLVQLVQWEHISQSRATHQ